MPTKGLNSVNLTKQPSGACVTWAEVLAATLTICLTLGWGQSNGASARGQVSCSHSAAQRTKLAAKAANCS